MHFTKWPLSDTGTLLIAQAQDASERCAELGRGTRDGIDALLCDHKERQVEAKGNDGDKCAYAGHAAAHAAESKAAAVRQNAAQEGTNRKQGGWVKAERQSGSMRH